VSDYGTSLAGRAPSWRDEAACAEAAEPEDWWEPFDQQSLSRALTLCSLCPVQATCAAEGLALNWQTDHGGVYGGLTREDRVHVRYRRGHGSDPDVAALAVARREALEAERHAEGLRARRKALQDAAKAAWRERNRERLAEAERERYWARRQAESQPA